MGAQHVHGGQPGSEEGRAVIVQYIRPGLVVVDEHLIGGFYGEKVLQFDCIQEHGGECPDAMVERGWGLSRAVFVGSWRDLGGFAVVHGLVQVTYMVSWCAANQASLVLARRGSCAGSLSFLVGSLGGISMQGVLMEWSSWIHIEGLTFEQTRLYRLKCELNKRNNTRKRERQVGKENTLFYQTQIDDNFLKKVYFSNEVSYKIQIVIGVHAYK